LRIGVFREKYFKIGIFPKIDVFREKHNKNQRLCEKSHFRNNRRFLQKILINWHFFKNWHLSQKWAFFAKISVFAKTGVLRENWRFCKDRHFLRKSDGGSNPIFSEIGNVAEFFAVYCKIVFFGHTDNNGDNKAP
jgi:hypothetical protein